MNGSEGLLPTRLPCLVYEWDGRPQFSVTRRKCGMVMGVEVHHSSLVILQLFCVYGIKCVGRIVTKSMSNFLHLCDCSVPYCASLEA